jgi:hypothetical protein
MLHIYSFFEQHNGPLFSLMYWLAIPTLLAAQLLGAGKHDKLSRKLYVGYDYNSALGKRILVKENEQGEVECFVEDS